ncbi:hypothetical protein HDU89_000556 [Geranomyces variabilis]|nr:hypothetical protein HDU89_000556 [Geranomyces variabilis]
MADVWMSVRWVEYHLANAEVSAKLTATFKADAAEAVTRLRQWVNSHDHCPAAEFRRRREGFVTAYMPTIDAALDAIVEEKDLAATAALVDYVAKARLAFDKLLAQSTIRSSTRGEAFGDALAIEEAYVADNAYMSEEDAAPRLRALRRLGNRVLGDIGI